MPAKKKILSIKDKVKAQWKLEQAALKKADVGTTKSKVPLYLDKLSSMTSLARISKWFVGSSKTSKS